MSLEKTVPVWNAEGTEPPSSLKNSGFAAGYKPPADYFNWFWYNVSQCLTELQDVVENAASGIPIVTATSTDGVAYTATVEDVTELTVGMQLTIIPDTLSKTTSPTLNVNNLGAKGLRVLTGYNTAACVQGAFTGWIAANRPITVKYNGTYWIVTDAQRTSGAAIYGNVAVQNGGLAVNDETTDSDKSTALANLESIGMKAPFWATYGTTTNAEIEAAYAAGKIVLVKNADDSNVGILFGKNTGATAHFFIAGVKIYRCFNDTWADISANYGFTPASHTHDSDEITPVADTDYTTLKVRGQSLNSSETTPALNGNIAWEYS